MSAATDYCVEGIEPIVCHMSRVCTPHASRLLSRPHRAQPWVDTPPPIERAVVAKIADCASEIDYLKNRLGQDPVWREQLRVAVHLLHQTCEEIDRLNQFGIYAEEDDDDC